MPSKNSVLNEERRSAILELLKRDGRAVVRDLAIEIGTSEVTIRRDLDVLQKRGLLHRTHGGALPLRTSTESDFNLAEHELEHPKEKIAIAEAAARMVQEGQTIVLGSGSTTTAIARSLRSFRNLTVITNSITVAAELAGTDVEVILTGGVLRKQSRSLIGPLAELSLSSLRADTFFMGTDGINTNVGLFTQNLLGAQLVRVMVEMSARTIVVCDSSKFGKESLYTVIPISKVRGVITDKHVPESALQALRELNIEVTLV